MKPGETQFRLWVPKMWSCALIRHDALHPGKPVGARNGVVAGQAACLYSLMRPSQRVVRTSRRGDGWSVVLLSGV